MRTAILIVAVLSVAVLRLSEPGAFTLSEVAAVLAMLAALSILFLRAVDWSSIGPLIPVTVAASVALYGLHPATIAALRASADWSLVACIAGTAAGIAICCRNSARPWHRWAALLPAIPCILLHRAGIAFAPLLGIAIWLRRSDSARSAVPFLLPLWPALVVSIAAGLLHRADPYNSPIDALQSLPGMVAGFLAPYYTSQPADWTIVDAMVLLAVLVSGAIATAVTFALPAVSFGLIWFLAMALVAPGQPVAALPGLALAIAAGLSTALRPVIEARSGPAIPVAEEAGTGF